MISTVPRCALYLVHSAVLKCTLVPCIVVVHVKLVVMGSHDHVKTASLLICDVIPTVRTRWESHRYERAKSGGEREDRRYLASQLLRVRIMRRRARHGSAAARHQVSGERLAEVT